MTPVKCAVVYQHSPSCKVTIFWDNHQLNYHTHISPYVDMDWEL